LEQFEIVKRYLKRIEAMYEGVSLLPDYDKKYHDDDVISFFIHCYHVRDWVIHLNNRGVNAKEVDEYINSNRALSVCADLANGSKHCRLTRETRTEDQPHVSGSEKLTSTFGEELSVIKCKYRIMSNKKTLDALVLAKECVVLWDDFFVKIK
jgi:hypothetical protein